VIPEGRTLLLDMSPPALANVTIAGALVFDEADLDLTVGWIIGRGTLRVGTAAAPGACRSGRGCTGLLHLKLVTRTGGPMQRCWWSRSRETVVQ
jgi:G8 domain